MNKKTIQTDNKESTQSVIIRILSSPYIINLGVVGLIIVFSWSISNLWPFGSESIAMIDLNSQYLGFYDYFNHALRGQDGFMYSMYKGSGGGMFPLWTYYLMSPFNLIYLIFNGENIFYGVQIVYLMKLISMTITTTYYFKEKEAGNGLNLMLTIGWVFSSYMLLNRIHLMWLDAFILLPLLVLSLEDGLKNGKYIRYTIYLTLTIWSNYYIGYMVGLFTLIYVLYQYLIKEKDDKLYFWGYVRNCLYSGIMSLWVLIPSAKVLLAKEYTYSNIESLTHRLDISHSMILARFIDPTILTYTSNPPVLMMGTAILLMSIIVIGHVDKKRVRAYLIVLAIYLLTFIFRPVSRIWTLGQDETWYLHRYTFTFLWFNLVYIVQNKDVLRSQLSIKFKLLTTMILLTMVMIVFIPYSKANMFAGIVILFFTIIGVLFTYLHKKHRQPLYIVIQLVEILSLVSWFNVVNTKSSIETFRDTYQEIEYTINENVEITKGGRMHIIEMPGNKNHPFSYLQPMVSHTGSAISDQEREIVRQIGISGSYSLTGIAGVSDIAASLHNIQYIETKFAEQEIPYFLEKEQFEKITDTLYENSVRLGFGYTVSDIQKINVKDDQQLNEVTTTLLGKEYVERVEPLVINKENITVEDDIYTVANLEEESSITYKIPDDVNYVYYMTPPFEYKQENNKVELNQHSGEVFSRQIRKIPDNIEEVTYTLYRGNPNETFKIRQYLPIFYSIDNESLINDIDNYFDKHSPLENINYNKQTATLTGTLNNTHKQPYLQVNLPYDDGWSAAVNGQTVETIDSLNMLTIPIPEGESEIELTYFTPYLKESIVLSLIGLTLFGMDISITNRRRKEE